MSGLRAHRQILLDACTEAIDSMINRSETFDVYSDAPAIFDTTFLLEVTCPSMPQPSMIGCHIVRTLNDDGVEAEERERVLDQYRARQSASGCPRCGRAPETVP